MHISAAKFGYNALAKHLTLLVISNQGPGLEDGFSHILYVKHTL
jgi:hypothetical protein